MRLHWQCQQGLQQIHCAQDIDAIKSIIVRVAYKTYRGQVYHAVRGRSQHLLAQ